jgi:hypothetical protein
VQLDIDSSLPRYHPHSPSGGGVGGGGVVGGGGGLIHANHN